MFRLEYLLQRIFVISLKVETNIKILTTIIEMAKCTGPLYSLSASGKIANAMVYFTWKGVNVVREWLKPANPQSAAQGNQRCILGGTGRAVGEILPRPGFTTVSAFAQQLIDLKLIPGGQTKQSFLVKYILDHYLTDATAFGTELAAFTTHTYSAVFGTSADALGIVDFSLTYDSIAAYSKGLGLYLIAKSAIALGFDGTPYLSAIGTWVTADIEGMVADFTTA